MSFMIFIQGRKVPLKTFFNVTSVILIFVAAGMFTYGVHELESAKVIPYYGGKVVNNETKELFYTSFAQIINAEENNDRPAPINKKYSDFDLLFY